MFFQVLSLTIILLCSVIPWRLIVKASQVSVTFSSGRRVALIGQQRVGWRVVARSEVLLLGVRVEEISQAGSVCGSCEEGRKEFFLQQKSGCKVRKCC